MPPPTDDIKNWMNLFRWIVKLIRDEYDIDESLLVRTAVLETDLGLSIEQVEEVLEQLQRSFALRFPAGTLDEVLKLEELCMLAAWLAGMFKQPGFIGESFAGRCKAQNSLAA